MRKNKQGFSTSHMKELLNLLWSTVPLKRASMGQKPHPPTSFTPASHFSTGIQTPR